MQEKEKYLSDLNQAIERARSKGLTDDDVTVVKNNATRSSDDEQEQTIRNLEAQLQDYQNR